MVTARDLLEIVNVENHVAVCDAGGRTVVPIGSDAAPDDAYGVLEERGLLDEKVVAVEIDDVVENVLVLWLG